MRPGMPGRVPGGEASRVLATVGQTGYHVGRPVFRLSCCSLGGVRMRSFSAMGLACLAVVGAVAQTGCGDNLQLSLVATGGAGGTAKGGAGGTALGGHGGTTSLGGHGGSGAAGA